MVIYARLGIKYQVDLNSDWGKTESSETTFFIDFRLFWEQPGSWSSPFAYIVVNYLLIFRDLRRSLLISKAIIACAQGWSWKLSRWGCCERPARSRRVICDPCFLPGESISLLK
jgi:hypothetical protein